MLIASMLGSLPVEKSYAVVDIGDVYPDADNNFNYDTNILDTTPTPEVTVTPTNTVVEVVTGGEITSGNTEETDGYRASCYTDTTACCDCYT